MKVGDVFNAGTEYDRLRSVYRKVPRKLKKRTKKITLGIACRVISVEKTSDGAHTITLKPL